MSCFSVAPSPAAMVAPALRSPWAVHCGRAASSVAAVRVTTHFTSQARRACEPLSLSRVLSKKLTQSGHGKLPGRTQGSTFLVTFTAFVVRFAARRIVPTKPCPAATLGAIQRCFIIRPIRTGCTERDYRGKKRKSCAFRCYQLATQRAGTLEDLRVQLREAVYPNHPKR